MGDLIQSTPLISGLRDKYPSAKITMLVTSDFSDFVPFVPNIDDSRVLDLRQFKNSTPNQGLTWVEIFNYLKGFMDALKAENFDMLVNLSHSRFSALMVRYLAVKNVCGFNCNAQGERVIHHAWMQYFATEPFNRRFNPFNLVEIFTRSGEVDPAGRRIQLDESSITKTSTSEVLHDLQIKEGQLLIGIQAGSSLAGRRWPWQSFAELAERLVNCLDAKIVLLGVAEESHLAENIIDKISNKNDVLDLTGKTSLAQLAGVLKQCNYLVSNDTGTLHFAAALGTPVVGLYFAHAHVFETGPYYPGNLIFQSRISCAPCSYGVNCNHVICIDHVPPDLVAQMLSQHANSGNWNSPVNHPALSDIDMLETVIGPDDRLFLKPLIRHALTVEDLFQRAYEQLWLQVLPIEEGAYVCSNNLAESLASHYDCRGADKVFQEVEGKIKALKKLAQYGERGQHLTTRLIECLRTVRTSVAQLHGLGNDIESLDSNINMIGLTHPEVKPIGDIYIRRKENLQDVDLLRMATETRKHYQRLQEESLKLSEIVEAAVKRFPLHPVVDFQDETPSIKAAVPVR
jgi:ADP-heptose:LPS heptosyltransferase